MFAARLEGWPLARTMRVAILRDAALRAASQDEVRVVFHMLSVHFVASCTLKYFKSGGRWPFFAGIRSPSALRI